MALNGSGVNESDALMQIRVIEPMMEEYLKKQEKSIVDKIESYYLSGRGHDFVQDCCDDYRREHNLI